MDKCHLEASLGKRISLMTLDSIKSDPSMGFMVERETGGGSLKRKTPGLVSCSGSPALMRAKPAAIPPE